MRELTKRITCKNRDDYTKNHQALSIIKHRYLDRMIPNGWFYIESMAYESCGNAMWHYEQYFTIYKPNLNSEEDKNTIAQWELDDVLSRAKQRGVTQDGIWVKQTLEALGWKSKSYIQKHENCSAITYQCGYGGNYNKAKLVKAY